MKTVAMQELSGLVPEMHLFHADGDINCANWTEFKSLYNINGASIRSLVKEHIAVLKLKGNKRAKKTETKPEELQQYTSFLERKRNATFEGVAIFCVVTTGLERTTFSKWNGTISRAKIREDRRGCPFAILDFRGSRVHLGRGRRGCPFITPSWRNSWNTNLQP